MDESKSEALPSVKAEGKPVEVEEDKETIPASRPVESNATVEAAAPPMSLQMLTDKALDFLSHASNETLGACLVGLGATTYLVLGRVGLVIIGVAGGVVLHATWEGIRGAAGDEETRLAEQKRKLESGVEVARRALGLRPSRDAKDQQVKLHANQELDFASFGPETATALNTFTDAVIQDYVHYWYDPTLPGEPSFPAACRRTLVAFILSLSGHLRWKRPADAFLDFTTNASSIVIVFLQELASALNASPNTASEDAVATYLALKPESSLVYMLNQESQSGKLADLAEDILQAYLDPKAYNDPPVHVFLKEVLAQLVLEYTVTYCSRAEFINEWIVYGLEESETTNKVMNMVDAGVEGRPNEAAVKDAEPQTEAIARQEQKVQSRSQSDAAPKTPERPGLEHKRQMSRAEDAMDEAMREAQRLTQMMIEEDSRRGQDENGKQTAASSSEDISDAATHGAPTPTSSQSDKERQDEDATGWKDDLTPQSPVKAGSRPMTPNTKQQFTSFDQILPAQAPTALGDDSDRPRNQPPPLTLHNATINIFDDSLPNDRASIKNKPQGDYLIQVEPSLSAYSGWMIARKYADFEVLHEVLRRISVITGVRGFAQAHNELPRWRTNTKASLREELERYLTDAVRFQPLAESEGMKRFLEKDQGLAKSPSEKNKAFGWPTPDAFGKFGGDMMNVLTKAPKQVAGSGKAVFGGVAGLVGGVAGTSKRPGQSRQESASGLSRTSTNPVTDFATPSHRSRPSTGMDGSFGSLSAARVSRESVRSLPMGSAERHASIATTASKDSDPRPRHSVSSSRSRQSAELERSIDSLPDQTELEPMASQTQTPALDGGLEAAISLPPPPSEMPADFDSTRRNVRRSTETGRPSVEQQKEPITVEKTLPPTPPRPSEEPANSVSAPSKPEERPKEPLTERETSVAIELLFALITELYTLSSAWNIRRTLLIAAKNFLLRPGNPQLLSIRDMLQTSLLDSNLNDSGLAGHIYKLRENALPTAEEMEVWKRDYPERTEEQKEELRMKARALLVAKGMPVALQSVMGAAASGEALGRVFDCLQVPETGRALVFGILVQAVKVVTH